MSNPRGPHQGDEPSAPPAGSDPAEPSSSAGDATAPTHDTDHEPATEVISPGGPRPQQPPHEPDSGERRFTAPSGFDAGSTQKIDTPPEPATEVFPMSEPTEQFSAQQQKVASPQVIPPRGGEPPRPPQTSRRSWGWVIAVVLVIAALVAIAVLGTLLLTRDSDQAASQEDQVRATIEDFDTAIQSGDLATLRTITCGATRDNYVKYDDKSWADTHERVAAAKQYPVVASVDQVVVNGDHAEANVTTFMAFAPQTRSTRSFDLQFRDEQWKICQAPTP
jgi:flagellar basal body-associated protein FliL